jgi:hypothetical protein
MNIVDDDLSHDASPSTIWRQLREIADEWDRRPDTDASLVGRRRHVGGLFRGGDVPTRPLSPRGLTRGPPAPLSYSPAGHPPEAVPSHPRATQRHPRS